MILLPWIRPYLDIKHALVYRGCRYLPEGTADVRSVGGGWSIDSDTLVRIAREASIPVPVQGQRYP